jgi:formylglycine-generating enzyme required for sulfatase activity
VNNLKRDWAGAARAVRLADSDNFVDLTMIAGLNPKRDLRFADWTGVDFRDCDLRGFDFTGARLHGCSFSGAKITGACFDQAEVGAVSYWEDARITELSTQLELANLQEAEDWMNYVVSWRRSPKVPRDDHLPVGAIFQDAPFGPQMVVVPSGQFWMGSGHNVDDCQGELVEDDGYDNERPRRLVAITNAFAIARHPVTVADFAFAVDAGLKTSWHLSDPTKVAKYKPATNVTWEEAIEYVTWLARVTGTPYRLPSEAEWEYCCRAGTSSSYSTGHDITTDQAEFAREKASEPAQVGMFSPNAFGLHDMHGGVWEWCQDTWHANYKNAPDRSVARSDGNQKERPMRGGAWHNRRWWVRSAARKSAAVTSRFADVGFRVVRSLRV